MPFIRKEDAAYQIKFYKNEINYNGFNYLSKWGEHLKTIF